MGNFMFNRLDFLLKQNGMTRKALCTASGHADNYIRMFEKRNTEPPRSFVNFCAEQLGTTSAYLFGETDDSSPVPAPAAPEQKEKPTPSEESELNAHAKAILYKYEQLDPAQRVMFEKMLDAALEAAKGKENG